MQTTQSDVSAQLIEQAHVVFSLHGIRTRATWQRGFADMARDCGWSARINRWSYGYFSVFRFLLPSQRKSKLEWFNKTYQDEMNDRSVDVSDTKLPSIVVHSFGSYILGNALLKYETIRFNRIILCGSILPRDYPWNLLLDRGQIQAVRNEYGVKDNWSRIVRWFVSGAGDSGLRGFFAKHPRLEQQCFEYFAHSDYFDAGHMRSLWFPFLNKEIPYIPEQTAESLRYKPKKFFPVGLYVLYGVLAACLAVAGALMLPGISSESKARLYLAFVDPPDTDGIAAPYRDELIGAQGQDGGIGISKSGGAEEQAWTTAQTIRGVSAYPAFAGSHPGQVRTALNFLEHIRRKGMGQEVGWGLHFDSKHTITEINAWVQLAYLETLRVGNVWNSTETPAIVSRVADGLQALCERQTGSGGWGPIVVKEDRYARTYSTMMAVWALAEAQQVPATHDVAMLYDHNLQMGVQWLLNERWPTLGWVENPSRLPQNKAVLGLDAQTFFVMSRVAMLPNYSWVKVHDSLKQARASVLTADDFESRSLTANDVIEPGDQTFGVVRFPGGPEDFSIEGSGLLWYPWLLAAYDQIELDPSISYQNKLLVQARRRKLLWKIEQGRADIDNGEMYVPAEALIGIAEGTRYTGPAKQ